jgi:hypothetical protein
LPFESGIEVPEFELLKISMLSQNYLNPSAFAWASNGKIIFESQAASCQSIEGLL